METRTIDGRVILKHGADGDARFVEQREHRVAFTKPDGSKGDRVRYEDVPIFDEAAQREKFRRTRGSMDFSRHAAEPEPSVHAELATLPPLLAAKLQATLKLGPAPMIEAPPAGELYISKTAARMFGVQAVEAAVERHCAGDWGQCGRRDDVGELTPDMRWCRYVFGQGVQNAVAIETHNGIVQSRCSLRLVDRPGPDYRPEMRPLSVATLFTNGERVTLCWFSDDPAGPGGRI